MNIVDLNVKYRITVRKLRMMHRDGVLKVDSTPAYWSQAIKDIKNGKMSARAIALAFRYPKKLESMHDCTLKNRETLDAHFAKAGLPAEKLPDRNMCTPICGVVEEKGQYLDHFVGTLKMMTPDHWVSFEYLAVRILLSCDTDHQMDLAAEYLVSAFALARQHPAMEGWYRKEPKATGGHTFAYRRPITAYDL